MDRGYGDGMGKWAGSWVWGLTYGDHILLWYFGRGKYPLFSDYTIVVLLWFVNNDLVVKVSPKRGSSSPDGKTGFREVNCRRGDITSDVLQ